MAWLSLGRFSVAAWALRVAAAAPIVGLAAAATLGQACSSSLDGAAPQFYQVSQPGDTFNDSEPYAIWATTTAARGALDRVDLYWSRPTDAQFSVVAMTALGGGAWQGAIPPQPRGTSLQWFLRAVDANGGVGMFPAQADPPKNFLTFKILQLGEQPSKPPVVYADAGQADAAG